MNKFSGFRDYVLVRKSDHVWRQAVDYVLVGLRKLIGKGYFSESYSLEAGKLEPRLFRSVRVIKFLQKNGISSVSYEDKNCGTEGCVYFYGDKVLKCTLGRQEWEIAGQLKGDRSICPVIDVDFDYETKVYLILSWRLKTEMSSRLEEDLRRSGWVVSNYFNIMSWTGSKESLERWLDINSFREYARSEDYYSGELTDKLFELVVTIFRRSGYFLTGDLHAGNMGFDGDRLQLFDLGYPKKFWG